ncbi:IclR family transcriptional regulator [Succinatimonas hippei]|uniref:IclR family transcriptional regulator n=1 Tax=Succinatimonas hippei TaxID=626938 RepID=UPI0023F74DC8|nr:IclR family transcriptional regulator [Succinatimonas hippei]
MSTTTVKTATPALDKIMLIIDFIAHNGPQTFSTIYQSLALPKSSTSTLLNSMLAHKLLRQDHDKFDLGLRLYEIGSYAFAHFDIKEFALPVLKKLRDDTDLTCHLGILEGTNPVYLLKIESSYPVIINSWIGKRLSFNSSALGKIFLSFSPEQKARELLALQQPLPKFTPNTITDDKLLFEQIKEIKGRGYAIDDEEDAKGIFCLAAPILNRKGELLAAISMSGVLAQYDKMPMEKFVERLKEAAAAISLKTSD